MGTYTKFNYYPKSSYNWRFPIQNAIFIEGVSTKEMDNKGAYNSGNKEITYLRSIETNNFIAIFNLEDRDDCLGVDENGRVMQSKLKRLKKISLYNVLEYKRDSVSAEPIKEVHFEYDYSLCKGVPNQVEANSFNSGKLTLKKIYFTYGKNKQVKANPYEFAYSSHNYNYFYGNQDRWGTYKTVNENIGYFNNSEYPYTIQNKTKLDEWSSAWNLTEIILPSGGSIKVDYESDDYAYVQNKKAMRMYNTSDIQNYSNSSTIIKVDVGTIEGGSSLSEEQLKRMFLGDNEYLYFNCMTKINPNAMENAGYERITGYGRIESIHYVDGKLQITFETEQGYCPIVLAGLQYIREFTPTEAYQKDNEGEYTGVDVGDALTLGVDLFKNFYGGPFANDIREIARGPYAYLYTNKKYCRSFIPAKSYVRLLSQGGAKLGGGCRVKTLTINDGWKNASSEIKKVYDYTTTDQDGRVISSGVAAYEPNTGNDENPFRVPLVTYNEETGILSPKSNKFVEAPIGESFFPAPFVGYSRVTIKTLPKSTLVSSIHGIGKEIYEFYTTKDFPVKMKWTNVTPLTSKKSDIKITKYTLVNKMAMSQGFAIELNDMNGKMKSYSMIPEGQNIAFKYMKYEYKIKSYNELNNNVKIINRDGSISESDIGVDYDMTSDFRSSSMSQTSKQKEANLYSCVIPFTPPVTLLLPFPRVFKQKFDSEFKSATVTKVIKRHGILEKVTTINEGTESVTENLYYDGETGDVLISKTKNEFGDYIYSLNVPARWVYNVLDFAYKNIGIEFTYSSSASNSNIGDGDELVVVGEATRFWVNKDKSGICKLIDKDGVDKSSECNGKVLKIVNSRFKNVADKSVLTADMMVLPVKNNKLYFDETNKILDFKLYSFETDGFGKMNCNSLYRIFSRLSEANSMPQGVLQLLR